ncbi:Ubiquinol cytochrome c reductase, subunit QCR2 [Sesbania bispinosa]|nr:Ubiquinol cytochrome c reductase, subunit QCR2 [Sesbania bispinosa]
MRCRALFVVLALSRSRRSMDSASAGWLGRLALEDGDGAATAAATVALEEGTSRRQRRSSKGRRQIKKNTFESERGREQNACIP